MTKTQKIILFALLSFVTIGTITLAYGAHTYSRNRAVHEEYESFE
jgi:hypothetical protein